VTAEEGGERQGGGKGAQIAAESASGRTAGPRKCRAVIHEGILTAAGEGISWRIFFRVRKKCLT
jgi:hypothetical protein